MKKILIITDAWEPQVNGVVTTMTTVVKKLEENNFIDKETKKFVSKYNSLFSNNVCVR